MTPLNTVSQIYPSPWLKASDLQGQSATVTVKEVKVEEIRQPNGTKEPRIVLAFLGKSKRLICNKTQAFALVTLTGSENFENWKGIKIALKTANTRLGQDTIEIVAAPSDNPFGG